MTSKEKAAETRKANQLRRKYQARAMKAWETRRANLRAAGLLDADGNPTPKEIRKRRKTAKKVWATRHAQMAAAQMAA